MVDGKSRWNTQSTMKFLINFLVAILILAPLSGARADTQVDSFCDDLKYVLADALNEFRNRRGNYDFYISEYHGTHDIGPFKGCKTSSDQGVSDYDCEISDLPDDQASAQILLKKYVQKTKDCLGASIKKNYKVDDTWMRVLPDHQSIHFSAIRLESKANRYPSAYILDLEISYVDPSAP